MKSMRAEIVNEAERELFYTCRTDFKTVLKKVLGKKIPKQDMLFWPKGVLLKGLWDEYCVSDENEIINAIAMYFEKWTKKTKDFRTLDDAFAMSVLIDFSVMRNTLGYREYIDSFYCYLMQQRCDSEGAFVYRGNQQNDYVYVDSIGMVCPFLAKYYGISGEESALETAILQITSFQKNGMDQMTGLPYHGYSINEGVKKGIVGWGRAVGWFLLGTVSVLEIIEKDHKDYETIMSIFMEMVETTARYQTENGMFNWALTCQEGDNDSSATSMILCAILDGIRIGVVEKEKYIGIVLKGRDALAKKVDITGRVLGSSAECMGFGQYPQEYESNPWSVGPTLSLLSKKI